MKKQNYLLIQLDVDGCFISWDSFALNLLGSSFFLFVFMAPDARRKSPYVLPAPSVLPLPKVRRKLSKRGSKRGFFGIEMEQKKSEIFPGGKEFHGDRKYSFDAS